MTCFSDCSFSTVFNLNFFFFFLWFTFLGMRCWKWDTGECPSWKVAMMIPLGENPLYIYAGFYLIDFLYMWSISHLFLWLTCFGNAVLCLPLTAPGCCCLGGCYQLFFWALGWICNFPVHSTAGCGCKCAVAASKGQRQLCTNQISGAKCLLKYINAKCRAEKRWCLPWKPGQVSTVCLCTSVCLQGLDLHLRLIQDIQLWGPEGMDLHKMLWILNGSKHTQGRKRLLLFKDEVSGAVLPVENEMRKLPALIQPCKLENALWSRFAVPSVWEKSTHQTEYLCASLSTVGFCLLTGLVCLGLAQQLAGGFCFPNAVVGAVQP